MSISLEAPEVGRAVMRLGSGEGRLEGVRTGGGWCLDAMFS
jgi:hypothetical protein